MFQTIRDRYQEYKTNHNLTNEDVAVNAILASMFVGFVGFAAAAVVQEVKNVKDQNAWATSELESGRQVWRLEDGSLISTENVHIHL